MSVVGEVAEDHLQLLHLVVVFSRILLQQMLVEQVEVKPRREVLGLSGMRVEDVEEFQPTGGHKEVMSEKNAPPNPVHAWTERRSSERHGSGGGGSRGWVEGKTESLWAD